MILMHNKLPIQRCVRQSIKCTLPDFFLPGPVVCDFFLGTNTRSPHLRWDPEGWASMTRRCTERCRGLLKALRQIFFRVKKQPQAGRRACPRTGPGVPPAALGFDLGPIAPWFRRAGPCAHNLAPARPSPHRGLIFQSIIRFGMTGWVGDPTIGSPDLPSPPVDGPQPLVQPGRPLRGNPLCSGKRP